MSLFIAFGVGFLSVGISSVINASTIASSGVRVHAVVLGIDAGLPNRGQYALDVGYTTASGQQEQGVLDTPNLASSYPVGSTITVVYDPSRPSVVAMPKASSGGAWFQVVLGGVMLLLFPAAGAALLVQDAKRRSRVPATSDAL